MIIGQTICPGTYYGAWFAPQADGAVYSGDVIAISPSVAATLKVFIETKNHGEADAVAGTLTDGSIVWQNETGIKTTESGGNAAAATGAKELVRYKHEVTSPGAGWVHPNMMEPAWKRN